VRLSVLVADDHPAVLEGLTAFLGTFEDLNVVATCSDGVAALDGIRKFAPDVAVLDMVMPGLTGLEILSSLSKSDRTKVVILTAHASEAELAAALERGANIVHKDALEDDLIHCIRETAQERQWSSPTLGAAIARYQAAQRPRS